MSETEFHKTADRVRLLCEEMSPAQVDDLVAMLRCDAVCRAASTPAGKRLVPKKPQVPEAPCSS